MNTPTSIQALAGLPDSRHICPRCLGGSAAEKSLSVRVDAAGGTHWNCFRASCGYWGRPGGLGTAATFAAKKKEPRIFTRPTRPLDAKQWSLIEGKYGAGIAEEIAGYSYWDDRFMLPVYSGDGITRRGYVGYSFNATPKTLTYNALPDEPFIHYAVPGAPHMVVVEDWFSAEKVAQTHAATGVAIMGTTLGQDHITELVALAKEWDARVYLALDRDAYTKTLQYLAKYREQFPRGLYAWSLVNDLKYETTERIIEALDGKADFSERAQGTIIV